ncbi:MAG: HAMP domain-containing protein [Actinobacteria bacterium]|nr:HAMP domain-containing protein [Actinomycetota bacterium]
MRPLDPLRSIKIKLGAVIVAAVGVTVAVVVLSTGAGVSPVVSALAAGALSLGLVQVLAHGMTSPLREMAVAAKAMAAGDYDRRVTASSRDEVGELARAFNAMAADLGEVDRVRRDLVANVSHELRTPISSLRAVLENLVDDVQEASPETLHVMLRQVERLGSLVAQLVDLSRLESGAVPLQRRLFRLRPVLEDAATESRLHTPDVNVAVDVQPPEVMANGDPERVHQVVTNLLDNALRYSPPGATVELEARRGRTGVTIEVRDHGPGISAEESSRVFERFYRADAARSSDDGGAGLGLAIARWIVDLHGGDIRAERREPHGCRMVVELPAVRT